MELCYILNRFTIQCVVVTAITPNHIYLVVHYDLLKVAVTFDHSLYWIELLLGIAIWIKCLYLASVTVFPNLIGLGMVWHAYVLIKIRCKLLNIENFLTHCVKKFLANLTIFHFWFGTESWYRFSAIAFYCYWFWWNWKIICYTFIV